MTLTATFNPPRMSVTVNAPAVGVSTGTPVARNYVTAEPYQGEYTVTPLAREAVVLPTTNKMLLDDVTVTKVPYYETSNQSGGKTAYIAMEV